MPSAGLALGLTLTLAFGAAPLAEGPKDPLLVSASWLRQHLQDRNLVLLHIGDRAGYAAEHLPGARHLEGHRFSWRSPDSLFLELPPAAWLDSSLATLGISNDSRIVLYFGRDWVSPTTRAWFTFDYLGLGGRTSILNGGLPAWKAAGGMVTSEEPPVAAPGRLRSVPSPSHLVTAEALRAELGRPNLRIIDARNRQFFLGFDPGSGSRPGHLPGARNLVYETVVDSARQFLPDSALARLFRDAGVAPGDRIVVYCHIGQQATAVYFAARLLGYDVRLYDGSFQDWSRRSEYPLDVAIPATRGGLITPAALAEQLKTGGMTVIDARSDRAAYLTDHIPGARYLDAGALGVAPGGVLAAPLGQEAYAALWGRLGIRRDRPVVIYGHGRGTQDDATVPAWLLAGFRHPEVYVLDGGYARWVADGGTRAPSSPEPAPGSYEAQAFFPDDIGAEEARHGIGDPEVAIVDVRPADAYQGTAGAGLRRGHIPGAIHHFWRDDLEPSAVALTWKPVEALRRSYLAQGITPEKFVVVYGESVAEATHTWFALKVLLGYPQVGVYAPGWADWAGRTELPIEAATGDTR
ncbi:MAG: sulfurtransferase [Gemmatimonadetes bacterium]|nr:sulfurtransferase [Gemmatimonadota bacterium]MBK7785487.1 sulfurtransferase [Gemmatimonadota bacterium]MBK7923635.1 sulfurtransferase [Gemmatimonadota bacterium]